MTLPSRITDTEVDDLPLDLALEELLVELLAEAPFRRHRWPLAVAAAAASVAAVVAVPSLLAGGPTTTLRPETPVATSGPASEAAPTPTASAAPQGGPQQGGPQQGTPWVGPSSYAVLDAVGWSVDRDGVETDPGYGVGVTYTRGGTALSDSTGATEAFTLHWIRAEWFADLQADNLADGTPSTLRVLGQDVPSVEYASQQQMAFVPVRDGYGLRIDGSFTTPATFRELVTRLREVDEAGFASSLPDAVVLPSEAAAVATEMYDATEHPDGVGFPTPAGFNSRYHVAAQVVPAVGCAWLEQFVAARKAGDAPARESAVRALRDSRSWAPVTDDLRQPGWFDGSVEAMEHGAPDRRVLGSGGCAGAEQQGSGEGRGLADSMRSLRDLATETADLTP